MRKPIRRKIDKPADDPSIRGVDGGLWAILTPLQRDRYRQLIKEGMDHSLAYEVALERIESKSFRIGVDTNANPANPLQRATVKSGA